MWTSHWPRERPKGWCTPQTPVVSGEELHEAEEAILAGCCQNFQNSRDSSGALEVVCVVCMRDGAVHLTFILRQSLSLNFQLSNWQHWLASKLQDSAYLCPASTGLQMGSTNTQVLVSKLQASRLYVTERAVSQPHVLFGKHIET